MQDAIKVIREIMQDFSGHWHQEIDAKFSCNRLLIVNDTENYTMGHFFRHFVLPETGMCWGAVRYPLSGQSKNRNQTKVYSEKSIRKTERFAVNEIFYGEIYTVIVIE